MGGQGRGREKGGCCLVVENDFTFKVKLTARSRGLYHACECVCAGMDVKLAADGIICLPVCLCFLPDGKDFVEEC